MGDEHVSVEDKDGNAAAFSCGGQDKEDEITGGTEVRFIYAFFKKQGYK